MKKGFTLIELLAVIIILAILMIIAVPNILSILQEARRGAFITQTQSIYKAAEQQYILDTMTGNSTTCYDKNNLDLGSISDSLYFSVVINETTGSVSNINVVDTNQQLKASGTNINDVTLTDFTEGTYTCNGSVASTSYVVTFDANGGSVDTTKKRVTVGAKYGELPIPTREGYTFKGWNGKNKYDIGTLTDYVINPSSSSAMHTTIQDGVASGIVLSGAISWIRNDKLSFSPGTYSLYEEGSSSKRHLLFLYDSEDNLLSDSDVTLNSWTYNSYYKAWFYDGEVAHVTIPPVVNHWKFGFVFLGGTYGNRKNYNKIQIETGNISTDYEPYLITSDTTVVQDKNHTLTAMWEPSTFIVTFNTDGGQLTQSTKEVTYLEAYGELPTPTKEGYTFKGWNSKNIFNSNKQPISSTTSVSNTEELLFMPNTWDHILYKSNWNPKIATTYTLVTNVLENTFSNVVSLGCDERFYIETYSQNKIRTGFTGEFVTTFITRSNFSNVTLGSLWYNHPSNTTGTFRAKIAIYEGTELKRYEPFFIKSDTKVVQSEDHTLTAIWEQK